VKPDAQPTDAVPPPTAGVPLTQAAAPTPPDARISIDEFMKIDLRVAKITAAEKKAEGLAD